LAYVDLRDGQKRRRVNGETAIFTPPPTKKLPMKTKDLVDNAMETKELRAQKAVKNSRFPTKTSNF
jgi:ribosomal protein L14E/L6E/L27E